MAFITSSTTVILQASLTETGRKYLFGVDKNNNQIRFVDGTDQFKPTAFSVLDGDTNYKSSSLISTGGMPNIKGLEKTTILSTCSNSTRKNFVVNGIGFNSNISFEQSLYNINEVTGNNIKINFSLGQNFNFQSGIKKFLVYNDTNISTYTGATIDGFSSITYNNVSYFGKIFEVSDEQTDFSTYLTIFSGRTLAQDQSKNIYLKILPITNCNLGLIDQINVSVIGVGILQPVAMRIATTVIITASTIPDPVIIRNIKFSPNYFSVSNSPAFTVRNIQILLNDVEFKNISRTELSIVLSSGLGSLKLSPITIELLSPISNGTKVILSNTDIANLLEQGKNIPLNFENGKKELMLKVTKPKLNISTNQSILFSFVNYLETVPNDASNSFCNYQIIV